MSERSNQLRTLAKNDICRPYPLAVKLLNDAANELDDAYAALRAFEYAFKDAKITCEGLANTMNLGYAIEKAKAVLLAAATSNSSAIPDRSFSTARKP